MKNFILLLCTALTFLIAGCTGAGGGISENSHADSSVLDLTRPIQPPADLAGKRVLVAFFSRTGENYEVGYIEKGNTHIVAEQIAALTKADAVFEIRTTAPYPVDYQEMTRVAKEEQAENARPALAARVEDMASYDVIYLGYPIWYQDLPMPVYTFLESYDFTGKTIIPFCTGMGSAMSGKEQDIPLFAKGAHLRAGLGLQGKFVQQHPEQAKLEIANWLATLGYTN